MSNSSKNSIRDQMRNREQSLISMIAGTDNEANEKTNKNDNVATSVNYNEENSDLNNEYTNVSAVEKNSVENVNYGSVKTNVEENDGNAKTKDLDLSKLDMMKIKKVGKKNKRERFEETHKKATFWIKNELLEAFNNAVDHGLKSEKINEAIYDWLLKQQEEN
jgi:hypothetical protein